MAHSQINAMEVINISNQTVVIHVQPLTNSTLFEKSGHISLKSKTKIIVEESRLDLQQLFHIANKNLITYSRLILADVVPDSGGTGSGGTI